MALWPAGETPDLAPFDRATVRQSSFRGGYVQLELELEQGLTLLAQRSCHLPPVAVGDRVELAVRELFALDGDGAFRVCHQAPA